MPEVDDFVKGTVTKWMEDIDASIGRLHGKVDKINGRVRETELELARSNTRYKFGLAVLTLVLAAAAVAVACYK